MAVNTITYDNKVTLNENTSIADINKCKASDMNEIKSVVNNNATELENAQNHGFLTLSTNVSASLSANSVIPLNNIFCQEGSGLTADTTNYRITIGSGVSKVKVSFSVQGSYSSRIRINLRKNGTIVNPVISNAINEATYAPIVMTTKCFDVEEGDYFDCYLTDNSMVVSTGLTNAYISFMTIEY